MATDISTFTPEQQKAYAAAQALIPRYSNVASGKDAAGNTIYSSGVGTPPPAITSDALNPSKPLNVPPYTPPPLPPIPDIATLIGAFNQETSAQRTAQAGIDSALADTRNILARQAQRPARQAELETQTGLPQLQTQLKGYYDQINAINASAFQAQQNAEGRLAPTFAITGEQAQIERQKSAQTYGLAAAAQALQGNIALANDFVKRSLDAEFGGEEYKLKLAELNLEQNRAALEREDKKRTQQLEIALSERARLLADQKTNQQGKLDLAKTLASFQAPQSVVNTVLSSSDYSSALSAAAPYLRDPKAQLEVEKINLDMAATRAQIEQTKAQTAKIRKETVEGTATERKEAAAEKQAKESELQKASQALSVISQLKVAFSPSRTTSGTTLPSTASRAIGTVSSRTPTLRNSTADFERAHDQLKALLSLDNYKLLKGTGQISNYEGQLLANAATQLDLRMSESGYQKELAKLEEAFNSILTKSAQTVLDKEEKATLDAFFSMPSMTSSLPAANYYK